METFSWVVLVTCTALCLGAAVTSWWSARSIREDCRQILKAMDESDKA